MSDSSGAGESTSIGYHQFLLVESDVPLEQSEDDVAVGTIFRWAVKDLINAGQKFDGLVPRLKVCVDVWVKLTFWLQENNE